MNYGYGRPGFFVKISMIAIICVCIATIVRLEVRYNELEAEAQALKMQISAYEDEVEQLEGQLEQELDDEYVIRIAREKLNYCMPDEIMYYDNNGN
ncbi:MAG: hypothetical protein E7623_01915 [Ruminococcaceae bacterium]|nr:hypothetical protein [Oscillospiraceae bacterium]